MNTLPKTVVGFGAGQDWAILGNPGDAERTEVGYISKGLVGFGAGQDWALVYKGNPGEVMSEDNNFVFVAPAAIAVAYRRNFCRRYVKSLGYLRREKIGGDKRAFIQAMNECLVNFKKIKKGQYKMKPADTMGANTDLNAILAEAEKETGISANDVRVENVPAPTQKDVMTEANAARQAEERTGVNKTWIIVAAVAVLAIIAVVFYLRSRKSA